MELVPLLSIISVNYNSAEHTIEMVKSARASQYPNLQIIVVDNASNEEDFQKLSVIDDLAVVIRSEENLGFSGGNNIGLRYAQEHGAAYAMLLNNDTIVNPNTFSDMVACLDKGEADVVSPKILNYYNPKEIGYAGGQLVSYKGAVTLYGIGQQDVGQYDVPMPVTFASGCCVLASMELWQKIGFMDEKYFLYFEDTALSAEFVKLGKRILYLPQAVVYHKESVSTQKYSDNYQYYFCRNRLLYISEHIAPSMRLIAQAYTLLYVLKHFVLGHFALRNIKAAFRDYHRHCFGRRK